MKEQSGSLVYLREVKKQTTDDSEKHHRRRRFAEVKKKKTPERRRRRRCSSAKAAKMLFSPKSLSECVREWDDLEKNYQQIQVSRAAARLTSG